MSNKPATAAILDPVTPEEVAPATPENATPTRGIASPASEPKAAETLPATGEGRPRQRPVITADVRTPDIAFANDPATLFPGHPEAHVIHMMALVRCHVVDGFKGTLKNAYKAFQKFEFSKGEVVLLPRWFALDHPTRLVIKE